MCMKLFMNILVIFGYCTINKYKMEKKDLLNLDSPITVLY